MFRGNAFGFPWRDAMKFSWKRELTAMAILAALACATALAQDKKDADETHRVVNSADLRWTPIIAGWELAVVSGNPDKEGESFVIRIHGKDGAKLPAHWHPTEENVTVLKGTFLMGVGEKYDESQLQPMSVGAFAAMPKEMRHFARAKGDTLVQVHGSGPFKVNWVNPAEVVPPPAKQK
jgi:quercetin dioxygenase-like cupin family protein